MYIAGKFSMPGLYENLSTNNIRNDEKGIPGSMVTFLTSRPTCKKQENAVGCAGSGTLSKTPDSSVRLSVLDGVRGRD